MPLGLNSLGLVLGRCLRNVGLPEHWSATENVAWKAPIAGRGWSSPIAWGDRVFLTTVVGRDEAELPQKGSLSRWRAPRRAVF